MANKYKLFSEDWWKSIEKNNLEPAKMFGPDVMVVSKITARAMILKAIKSVERKNKKCLKEQA